MKLIDIIEKSKIKAVQAALPAVAMIGTAHAELPTMDAPTRGEGSGIMETMKNYLYDGGIIAGLVICTVVFLVVAQQLIAGFKEAREKEQWGKFGVTVIVAVVLLVAVIWFATEAADVL